MPNYIIYFAHSIEEIHECAYSLLKYLDAYNLKPPAQHSLVVHTSKPALLESYCAFFNQFQFLEGGEDKKQRLDQVLQFSSRNQGNFLYLDTMTYPLKTLDTLFAGIGHGTVYSGSHKAPGQVAQTISYLGINDQTKASAATLLQRGNAKSAQGVIGQYEELKEFRQLLKHFFQRHQEESIPNQVKLLHHIDAEQIQHKKHQFRQLPLMKRLLQTVTGKGWNISRYKSRI